MKRLDGLRMVRGFAGFAAVFLLFFSVTPVLAQTSDTSEQTTLSGDLQNNPLAQEILKKIEQTKQWIAELEERNYEKIERQRELDEKREQALQRLRADLAEWEKLWEYYSPHASFERFVEGVPDSQVQEVFWDQFEFKEQKVKAGRDALKQVLSDGGSLRDGIQAYRIASETKRIELIEANSQFNVNHNLAYYNQQVLFDINGKFVDSPITGEQLREYYEDFRTNPAYLTANPADAASWEDLARTSPDTKCPEGEIVVHRFHADDYVCVTMSTAEMWIQHGMGEIAGDSPEIFSEEQSVSPLTRCDSGFTVIFNTNTEKYSCVLEDTAQKWVGQGTAVFPNSDDYIADSIRQKESIRKIDEVNVQISEMRQELELKKLEIKKIYDKKYGDALEQSKTDEKNATLQYNQDHDATKEELSAKILQIRNDYEDEKEDILKDKIKEIKLVENEHKQKIMNLVELYESDPYIEIVPDSGKISYHAVLRE